MSDDIQAFPLQWPPAWKRTTKRTRANFGRQAVEVKRWSDGTTTNWKSRAKLTIADSRDRVRHELSLLGAKQVVISSNLRLRMDGQPASGQSEPTDPGVCVYFQLNNQPRCLPCDKWDRAADNLAAIAKYVDALRGQLRWGVGSVDVAFSGFKALPGGDAIPMPGRMSVEDADRAMAVQVGVPFGDLMGSVDKFKSAWRAAALKLHPDATGNREASEAWKNLQAAADVLKRHHGI